MAEDQYIEIQQEDLRAFLADPENEKTATALALQLRSLFGRKWFTLAQVKKEVVNAHTIETFELPVLKAYNLLKVKNGKYRVVLTVLEKMRAKGLVDIMDSEGEVDV